MSATDSDEENTAKPSIRTLPSNPEVPESSQQAELPSSRKRKRTPQEWKKVKQSIQYNKGIVLQTREVSGLDVGASASNV